MEMADPQPIRRIPRLQVVRLSVTPQDDLLIRRPLVTELLPRENAELWRSVCLIKFSSSTYDAPPPGPLWLTVRANWRVAAVVIQLKGTIANLIGHHLLSYVGHF